DRQPCTIGQFKVISALNVGGKSTGLAIVFTGSYIEHEEIRFRDVKLEYRFGLFIRIIVVHSRRLENN
ncbi:MAG: hypothetical protein II480_11205, partial [Bacteroidales bacterium]|nr:hypothetical protein [Bacteroidales bacterium]